MKRLTSLLVCVLLFAACKPAATEPPAAIPQPLPTPTTTTASEPTDIPPPVITEEKADAVSLTSGIWYIDYHDAALVMSINGGAGSGDLTYSVYVLGGFYRSSGGTAKIEDGKLYYLTDFSTCADAPEATYEFYIVKEDGFITSMHGEPVGSDGCPERADASSGIYVYSGPAARSSGDEQPPKKGGELLGLWYSKDGQLMIYSLAKLDLQAGITDINISLYDTRQDPWLELGTGTARYQDEKITFLTNKGMCDGAPEAVYGVKMVDYNEKMIGMLLTSVGDDPCADRKNTLDNQFIWNVDP